MAADSTAIAGDDVRLGRIAKQLGAMVEPLQQSSTIVQHPEQGMIQAELERIITLPEATADWFARDTVFATAHQLQMPPGFVPLMLETLFNPQAQQHVNQHDSIISPVTTSYEITPKPELLAVGQSRPMAAMPQGAQVIMRAWWPVAKDQPTPLPLWQAHKSARMGASNGYLSWPTLTAIVPPSIERESPALYRPTQAVAFAGRFREISNTVALTQFHHRKVSEFVAKQWMAKPAANKLARLVLGRDRKSVV